MKPSTGQTLVDLFPDLATAHPQAWAFITAAQAPAAPGRPSRYFDDAADFITCMRALYTRMRDLDAPFTSENAAAFFNRDSKINGHRRRVHVSPATLTKWCRQRGFTGWEHLVQVLKE